MEGLDGDGYSYQQSDNMGLLLADQSKKVAPFEKNLPCVPGGRVNDPQSNSQYQVEISDDNEMGQIVCSSRVHFVDEPEIIGAFSENGLPSQDQDLPSNIQDASTVPFQSVVGSTEKSRQDEINCPGPSSILYSESIDIDKDQTLQVGELLTNIDQISSLTRIMSNDANNNEAPESQDTFNSGSVEYAMGVERVCRLSEQFLPNSSSAEGHQSACDPNINTQYATKWESAQVNEDGEYIVTDCLNSKPVSNPKTSCLSAKNRIAVL